jgi:Clostripain family
MKRRLLLILALLALTILSISPIQFAMAQGSQAKWTVMVYIAANNNLEPNSIINLMEMAAVGSTQDVNIVAQITRPPDYQGFYGEWGGTRRFLVTKSDGGLSSGDFQISPTRFADFVNAVAPNLGLTQDQISQITRGNATTEEQVALQLTVPTIETETPLTPLELQNVQDLGTDVNSGDGTALTDFGTWAVQNYPADHYGLILWDHGGGWSMIASDDTLAPGGIHMPDLQKALDSITKTANQKLDFVGFDACLMAQLPVSLTLQPYADYQIAAEELVPGFGWDYTPPLSALVANPDLSVPDFAKAEIDGFDTLYSTTEKEAAGSYDMGLIDLSKTDPVVQALSDFDSAVKASSGDELKAISTARSNVQQFGSVGESPDITDAISSVDLSDFMRLMTNLSSDAAVKQAAGNVMQAVSQMVLYHKASKTLPQAQGLSIFFPPNGTIFTSAADGDRYRQEFGSVLPEWQDFLDNLYGTAGSAAQGATLSLKVTDVSTTQQPGSIYDTPVITYDMDGKNVVDVTANIIYQIDEKTNVVLDTFPITSAITTEDGSTVNDYPDGQSTNDFYWNTKIPSISDGTNSLLVLMTTNAKDEQHGFIRGTYTNKVTGAQSDAVLLIDLDSYLSSGLWVSQSQSNTVAQVTPRPGDVFEPTFVILDSTGAAQFVPSGVPLTFGKDPFQVTDAPGPDGTYTVVLQATDAAGTSAVDSTTIGVQNSGLDPSLQGFKDLTFGLSFLYPGDWTDVSIYQRADGTDELYVTDISGEIYLSAVNYSDATSLDDVTATMQDDVNSIDGVKVGDTSDVQVGQEVGTLVTYQYTDADGVEIDGAAVAVYASDTQQGYVLTIEAPSNLADQAQQVLDGVLSSSQFFQPVQ